LLESAVFPGVGLGVGVDVWLGLINSFHSCPLNVELRLDKIRKLLKKARIDQGIAIEQLAETLSCSVDSLVAFETGDLSLEADLIFGLVNALNVSPEVVLPIIREMGFQMDNELNPELSSDLFIIRAKS
jgi:transcriptional regulator with XRE-family HTH domain